MIYRAERHVRSCIVIVHTAFKTLEKRETIFVFVLGIAENIFKHLVAFLLWVHSFESFYLGVPPVSHIQTIEFTLRRSMLQ